MSAHTQIPRFLRPILTKPSGWGQSLPELFKNCAKNLRVLIHLEYSFGHTCRVFGMYQPYPSLRTLRESQLCCFESESPFPITRTIRVSIAPNSEGRAKRRTLLKYVGPNPFIFFCSVNSGLKGFSAISLIGCSFSYRVRKIVSGHLTLRIFRKLPHSAIDKMSSLLSMLFFATLPISVSSCNMFGKPFCQVSSFQQYSLYRATKS